MGKEGARAHVNWGGDTRRGVTTRDQTRTDVIFLLESFSSQSCLVKMTFLPLKFPVDLLCLSCALSPSALCYSYVTLIFLMNILLNFPRKEDSVVFILDSPLIYRFYS